MGVWSKISNALKRLGFQSHNFLAQLLSETSRACTIWVRRSTLGRLRNELVWSAKTSASRNLHDSWCRFRPLRLFQRTLFGVLALCEADLPCCHFEAFGSVTSAPALLSSGNLCLVTIQNAPGAVRTQEFADIRRSEEHTSELQSLRHLVCRLLLEKKTKNTSTQ